MFDSLAQLEEIEGRPGWWTLRRRLIFTIERGGVELIVVIPEGFVTNLASTPRWLWWLLPPFGEYNRATILHDFLYQKMSNRFLADAMLRVAMAELASSWWKQIAFFYATRFLGGFYQHKLKAEVKADELAMVARKAGEIT